MSELHALHQGARNDQVRAAKAAMNRRLRARNLDDYVVAETPTLTAADLASFRKAAWALGALPSTYEAITAGKTVPVGVIRMIRNPGRRNADQLARAKQRISALRAARKKRAEAAAAANKLRRGIVAKALEAAQNYERNPGAYHYLAGGVANLVYLKPSPQTWRSDCSQFVASVYSDAGAPSPASVPHLWASTHTMTKHPGAKVTTRPKPGDLGMYGDSSGPLAERSTHHVELYCDLPGRTFIGHGSPPIDSLTPGLPDFYLTYDFLDA